MSVHIIAAIALGRRGRTGAGPRQGQSPARGAPDQAPRSGAALIINKDLFANTVR